MASDGRPDAGACAANLLACSHPCVSRRYVARPVAFLWEAYRPGCWWYELLSCFWRAAMSFVCGYEAPGEYTQIYLAVVLQV